MESATLDSDGRFTRAWRRKDAKRVDESMMIEVTIDHSSVKRIANEIVSTVGAERVAGHDLGKKLVPRIEFLRIPGPILQPDRNLGNIFRSEWRLHRRPDRAHLFAEDHVD